MWWSGIIFSFLLWGSSASVSCPDICLCDNEITNCQYNRLTELPQDVDFNVVSLDISYNAFTNFPKNMARFRKLKYLNVSHNQISTLMHSDFTGATTLERLDLSFNLFHDWKDIHSSTFLPTKKLQYLDFSSNQLRSIPRLSNHLYIESLIILRLVNCSMTTIPVNVFNRLTNLRELHLANNPVQSINESFQIDSLKFIDLSRCHLNYLEENVFINLFNLELLDLSQNRHLRKIMIHSYGLLYLDASACSLERIPTGNLTALTVLDVSRNFIKGINPHNFEKCLSLVRLNLSSNTVMFLPDQAFAGLTSLTTLDLSFNKIAELTERLFSNLTSLLRLNLSHNYFKSIDMITSNSLKLLNVSFCEIYDLHRFSLYNMPNLISLSVARNFMTTIPDGFYSPTLVYLDVNSCRIKSINNRTFKDMENLRQINIANNGLTNVDPTYFPRAISINIMGNPWRCECASLKRMYDWISTFEENDLHNLICDSPENFAGRTWTGACFEEWYPSNHRDHMWYYSVGIVVLMCFALCVVMLLKKIKEIKEKRIREEEDARRAEEREALRRMQEIHREWTEDEDRTAPDPRELQRPPSYTEAMLLPRLDASQASLNSIASRQSRQSTRTSNNDLTKKKRRKKRRRKSTSDTDIRASRTQESDSSDDQFESQRSLNRIAHLRSPQPLESDF